MIDRAILVTGDRLWTDIPAIRRKLEPLDIWHSVIIHGCATGADGAASFCANELGIPQIKVPYFSRYGKAGGPKRNELMLQILLGLERDGAKAEVWAFHDDLANSRGTKDMVQRAKRAGVVKVRHYHHTSKGLIGR